MKNLISKPLTEMQKEFARLHAENVGRLSNTEIAIRAGYKAESAYQRAYELLNPRICPHVVKYIGDMKEDFLKKNDIDPNKHLARLNHLALKAEEKEMFGVSLRAEELRGKVAGYYIDRIIQKNKTDADLTEEELEEKQRQLLETYENLISHEKEDKNDKVKSKRNGLVHKRAKNSN